MKYWDLAEKFGADFQAAQLPDGVVFVNLATPAQLQGSSLDFLMDVFGYAGVEELARDYPELGPCPCLQGKPSVSSP